MFCVTCLTEFRQLVLFLADDSVVYLMCMTREVIGVILTDMTNTTVSLSYFTIHVSSANSSFYLLFRFLVNTCFVLIVPINRTKFVPGG